MCIICDHDSALQTIFLYFHSLMKTGQNDHFYLNVFFLSSSFLITCFFHLFSLRLQYHTENIHFYYQSHCLKYTNINQKSFLSPSTKFRHYNKFTFQNVIQINSYPKAETSACMRTSSL